MRFLTILALIGLSLGMLPQLATADTLTVPFLVEYAGDVSPSTLPWLVATFDDGGTPGSVSLLLDNCNLVGSEFVGVALFNLDPTLSPGDLSFGSPIKTGLFDDPVIGLGANAFSAGGGGVFDIELDFAQSNADQSAHRFGAGESLTIEITGPSLTASSFDVVSATQNGDLTLLAAAHVQSLEGHGDGSGWMTVPEPSTFLLTAVGLLGLIGFARRRKR